MRHMLSVWLPGWPTQRLRRIGAATPDSPLATVETIRGMRRLADVCPLAAARGARAEQALAEARAICPDLEVMDADPAADRAALEALAAWCERYTPLAAVDPPDGLWLDITGCAHLLGGEEPLAADLLARLNRTGLRGRLAIAGTTGAAWALARSATARTDRTILAAGAERTALSVLPVALLRLEPRTVAGLRRIGLKSIGELARLPRTELASHFGAMPVLRLDQAFGRVAEPIAWPHPPAPWRERLAFAEPIGTPEDLARALALLADRLCARLAAEWRGGQRFIATFFRLDDLRLDITIATALPVRDAAYLAKLLTAKLETIDPGCGVEVMALHAEALAPLDATQTAMGDLAGQETYGQETKKLAATVDQLTSRLGEGRIWRPAPQASHLPERSVRRIPPLAARPSWEVDPSVERPVRLFAYPEPIEAIAPVPDDPPVQFRWRGALHRVRAASGPERIGAEWWRAPAAPDGDDGQVRDYYRVEDNGGGRFWIFRAGLHGAEQAPRWFLHGLFG